MAKKVNWYVSCSPRSPEKIQPELKVLANFEGKHWKGKQGNLAQEDFAKELANLPQFLGSTHEKEASFSTRDRVAPMKTYGFVYVNKDGRLCITDAGKMLAENRRPRDIFLKQLSKWQYPSVQHKGKEYPEDEWQVNPLVFVLRLLQKVETLSKLEIAIFCLTVTNNTDLDNVANEILKFRESLKQVQGQNEKLQFIDDYFYKKFEKTYGLISKIREGKSNSTNEDKVRTKMRNARDVADATTRYFRYTGLFVARGNKLVLNQEKVDLINEIISLSKINKDYNDTEKFHSFFGNPSLPNFSFENQTELYNLAKSYYDDNLNLAKSLLEFFPNVELEIDKLNQLYKSLNEKTDIETLKDIIYYAKELHLELKKKALQLKYSNPDQLEEVLNLLEIYHSKNNVVIDKIQEQFIANKNTVFEWLTWNGFIILGNAIEYKNNFIIDEELQPVTHAAGNQSDMEVEYDDFIVLGEVTTSSGATQFSMEAEPVTRHYLNKRKELADKGIDKELYCLFIAPKLNDNTFEEFMKYNVIHDTKIIPLSLHQFTDILKLQKKLIQVGRRLNISDIKKLLEQLITESKKKGSTSSSIKEGIDLRIRLWIKEFGV